MIRIGTLSAATVLCMAAASLSLPAGAQTLQPGLWELNTRMHSESGQMEKAMAEAQKQMAALPPEQRKMMQDMLAKQGVGMGAGGAGNMVIKVCMTPEMLARNEIVTQDGDCKTEQSPRAGNTMKMAFTCTQPPSSGEGTVTFVSPQAYTTQMTVTSRAGGKPETVKMDSQGRWLAGECGNVKPIAAARK
ncbi:MAG: DUF3617 domain-containing protein [Burkholderiaceae bacterium]